VCGTRERGRGRRAWDGRSIPRSRPALARAQGSTSAWGPADGRARSAPSVARSSFGRSSRPPGATIRRVSDLTPRARFRDRLLARPLLADGGMGTLLFSRGVPQRACLDELATLRPELVGGAHREYLEAGAELIVTLSLGANRHRLESFGLADRVARFNRRAAQVAREARDVVGREALVGGSIGPLGVPSHELATLGEARGRAPSGSRSTGSSRAASSYSSRDPPDLAALPWAVDEARRAADLPILASLTFGEELALPDGTSPGDAAAALAVAGVDAVGVNCGAGPVACLDALAALGDPGPGGPGRSIMPNAGLPQRLEGRFVYAAGADYFAEMTPAMLAAGPRIVAAVAARRRPTRAGARHLDPGRPRRSRPSIAPPNERAGAGALPQPRSAPVELTAWRRRRAAPTRLAALARVGSSLGGDHPPRRSITAPGGRRLMQQRASTSSTSVTRRWRGCGWGRWRSPSGSSTTWTSNASST